MASTTPTNIFVQPTEAPSGNSNPVTSSTNSLYLFTFLTTLLLLLGISCGIIFRAFLLRRRYRARIQAAIDAGILLPDGTWPTPSSNTQNSHLGAKPVLWDVSMYGEPPKAAFNDYTDEKGNFEWKNVMPVSATFARKLSPKSASETQTLPAPVTHDTSRTSHWTPGTYIRALFRPRQIEYRDRDPTFDDPSSPTGPSPPLPTSPTEVQHLEGGDPDKLLVSFLIAMPNPSKPHYQPRSQSISPKGTPIHLDSEDDAISKGKAKSVVVTEEETEMELPDIVFGVTEMKWKYGKLVDDSDSSPNEGTETNNNAGAGTNSSSAH